MSAGSSRALPEPAAGGSPRAIGSPLGGRRAAARGHPGPRMAHQGLHHLVRNRLDAPAKAPAELDDEVAHEQRNILGPFPKGRKVDWKHVQPIENRSARNSPSSTSSSSGRFVAAITRTSVRIDCVLPT